MKLILVDPQTSKYVEPGTIGRLALDSMPSIENLFEGVARDGIYLLPGFGVEVGGRCHVFEGDQWLEGCIGQSASQEWEAQHVLVMDSAYETGDFSLYYDELNDFKLIYPYPSQQYLADYYEQFESSPSLRNFNFEYHSHVLGKAIGVNDFSGLEVLDVAAGNGSFITELKKRGASVLGFEPSRSECEEALEDGIELIRSTYDPSLLPDGKQYDVIIAGNIFEHVTNPFRFMELVKAALKPEGHLFFQIPNDFSPFQRKHMQVNDDVPWFVCPPEHLNYWTVDQAKKFVERCGFVAVHEEAQFPIDIFLLMDMNYRADPSLGRKAHLMRCAFEDSFHDDMDMLSLFYEKLLDANVGRDYVAVLKLANHA